VVNKDDTRRVRSQGNASTKIFFELLNRKLYIYVSRPKSASFSSESEFSGRGAAEKTGSAHKIFLATARTKKQKTSLEKLHIYFVSTFFKYVDTFINTYVLTIQLCTYIIYGHRTIIGFVGFVANLLNKPTDGATVSVRKSASEKELLFVRL
jgi:hypothetical protein